MPTLHCPVPGTDGGTQPSPAVPRYPGTDACLVLAFGTYAWRTAGAKRGLLDVGRRVHTAHRLCALVKRGRHQFQTAVRRPHPAIPTELDAADDGAEHLVVHGAGQWQSRRRR